MKRTEGIRRIIGSIAKLSTGSLLAGSTLLSALVSLPVISGTSLILMHKLRYDYLLTGFLTAALVSFAVMYIAAALIEELNQSQRDLIASEGRIRQIAHFDALTGLPNRFLLKERITRALSAAGRHQEPFALLFIDLDRFKTINDTQGHHVGDELLKTVGERLLSLVREVDTVSRLGGDEFVLLLPDTDADGAAQVAQKARDTLNQAYFIEQSKVTVTPSIGISVYPGDGFDMDSLIKSADAAMYHAKGNGRNAFHFFRSEMNDAALERRRLEQALREGIEQQDFLLYFQPLVNVSSGEMIGIEALIRWNRLGAGLIVPDGFIAIAEASGLILPLGEWALREACRQNALWQKAGILNCPVVVNLSALQFKQPELPMIVRQTLRQTGLDGSQLHLELTETIVTEDAELTLSRLQALADIGVHFSIDEFGTSYSNLSYLKRLPIDKVKIDRAFIKDIPHNQYDAIIVRSIIDLAHSLRLKVVAEGVENREQLLFLREQECDEYQGYFFSRPLPAEELTLALHELKQSRIPWQQKVA